MVIITDYAVKESSTGEVFISLLLQGDVEFIQSQETGNFYATARKCSISSTFSESAAKLMIGKEMPGNIVKEPCDPYDYTIKETGEVVQLDYTYRYTPKEKSSVRVKVVKPTVETFSTNGEAVEA